MDKCKQAELGMRGGVVNRERVIAFRRLIRLLYKFKIITPWQYRTLKQRSLHINPLVSDNKFFIDKFDK